MSLSMWIPIGVLVLSNTLYAICAKSTPEKVDPYATLTLTYLVGAVCTAVMFFITNKGGNILTEVKNTNWTAWVLGIVIVGLEAGSIYMYKAGWNISTGQLVQSALLAVCLVFVGALIYKEQITASKLIGIAFCMVGLFFINKK